MTKKDFEATAAIIKNRRAVYQTVSVRSRPRNDHAVGFDYGALNALEVVALDMADMFAADNPRFDRARFLAACGIE